MCLGIPGEIVELLPDREDLATVSVEGVKRVVNVGLLEDEPLAPGDWILIHVGFALSKIDEREAKASLEWLTGVGDEVDDRLRGPVDDCGHGVGKPDPLVETRGLAADDEHAADGPVDPDALGELVEHAQDGSGVHAVRVEHRVVRGSIQIVLDQVERSGRLAVAVRVDQHERPVAVE